MQAIRNLKFYFKKNKLWMFKLMGAYTFNKNLINAGGLKFFKLSMFISE